LSEDKKIEAKEQIEDKGKGMIPDTVRIEDKIEDKERIEGEEMVGDKEMIPDFLVGTVVLRLMSAVMTPPVVSILGTTLTNQVETYDQR